MSLSERRFKCLRDVVGIVVVALISLCITACGGPSSDPNSEETAQARQALQEEIDKVDGDESLLDSSRYTSTAIDSFKESLEKAKKDVNDPGAYASKLERDLTYLKGSVTGLNLSTEKLKEQEAEEQEQEAKRQQEKAEKEAEKKAAEEYTPVTYEELVRNPENYEGKRVSIKGVAGTNSVDKKGFIKKRSVVAIGTDNDINHRIDVVYDSEKLGSKVIFNDWIKVEGMFDKIDSYGDPIIDADNIVILDHLE